MGSYICSCYSNCPDREAFLFLKIRSHTESTHGLKNGADCGHQGNEERTDIGRKKKAGIR